ncbi:ATP-binding region ATPase domain protein [[Leptolyngbya] sp. PCC 7376]|uniref:ATP-binding protein n=1 Tax=[Leptolyngbya] sp. PCC 7376 TaxID=111781 RepID=UPI00029F0793|nr:ATP-binding protein [[Leptolyngbya] sp. PCC 7376]AFY37028.1 ATP-binding region ATPase domain protein [[Leptolyngbya] sp. PCC 7376]
MNASPIESPQAIIFELCLPNQLSELERLNPWLEECAVTIGLSTRGTFRLQLLLEEVVMNIFENAYPNGGEHLIDIQLMARDTGLTIRIEDDGVAFDQTIVPEKAPISGLEEVQIGGIGLQLVHSYSDQQEYMRQDSKNILTLHLTDHDSEEN